MSINICPDCGAKGIDGSFIACGCNQPISKQRYLSPKRSGPVRIKRRSDLPCTSRKDRVGLAKCGCAGELSVYWCDKLHGHCTIHATGKPWNRIATNDGSIDRIEKLQPCIACDHRVEPKQPKKLLAKNIDKWHYITVEELSRDVMNMIPHLPPLSGVAGVPVSGMSAWLVASSLHVPLYQASFQHGLQPLAHGLRGKTRDVDSSLPILILDDTVSNGWAMNQIKQRIGPGNYLFACVYAKRKGMHELDFYGTEFEEPHLLEWNIANTGYYLGLAPDSDIGGAGIAIDFDGVISQDPPREFDERNVYDRQAYLDWLASAPLGPIVPKMYEVPLIVSYRCEYTRKASEHWLARHGVRYKELRLWPDSVSARTFDGRFKSDAYAEKNFGLFIESDARQARMIAEITRKKVLCTATNTVI